MRSFCSGALTFAFVSHIPEMRLIPPLALTTCFQVVIRLKLSELPNLGLVTEVYKCDAFLFKMPSFRLSTLDISMNVSGFFNSH